MVYAFVHNMEYTIKGIAMLKIICGILVLVVLAQVSLLIRDDGKVCFDYVELKKKAMNQVVGKENVEDEE